MSSTTVSRNRSTRAFPPKRPLRSSHSATLAALQGWISVRLLSIRGKLRPFHVTFERSNSGDKRWLRVIVFWSSTASVPLSPVPPLRTLLRQLRRRSSGGMIVSTPCLRTVLGAVVLKCGYSSLVQSFPSPRNHYARLSRFRVQYYPSTPLTWSIYRTLLLGS